MPEITDTRLRTLKKCSYVMGVTVTLRVRTVPPVDVGFWIFQLACAEQPLDRTSVVSAHLFRQR